MRIAGVDPELNFGGGEVQVMVLTLELLRAGHEAELLCDPRGQLRQRAQEAGIRCRPLTIRNSLDAAAGLRLRAILTRHHYDVVHFHTARAHAIAPYASRRAGALVVTRRMDYPPNRWFAPWLYNRAVDGVVAISEAVAQALLRSGVKRERIEVIASGVDCCRFAPPSAAARQRARENLGLMPDEIAIGAIGALVPRKGHRVLIDAMALGASEEARRTASGRLRCFIAGTGPLHNELAHHIVQNGLWDRVTLLGPIEEPITLLHAVDIFVMPSLNEGLGVAALEAAASGLPVVASAVGGLPEIVDDGRTGLLVKPREPVLLAEALRRLAADGERRAAMGAESRKRAIQNWSMEVMSKRTLNLYHACLEKKHGAASIVVLDKSTATPPVNVTQRSS